MTTRSYRHITDAGDFGRVAVLMGGDSAEREISLMSGQAVLAALLERGVDARAVDATGGFVQTLIDDGFDRVWNALHGRGGEDGAVQGLLQTLDLPGTGSGVLGSALAMDKIRTKQVLTAAGLPTPRWRQIDTVDQCAAVAADLGCPVFVKPALEGSSIGMSKVDDARELPAAFEKAAACNSAVLAEAWVSGPEFSASILHDAVLPLIRIDAHSSFYDYEAKYFSDATRYECPCGLPEDTERAYAAAALAAFRAVGASGWGRVDFMLEAGGSEPLILEVNTVPGMTSHSLVPMAAVAAGIDFGTLVWRILETSFASEASKRTRGASDAA